MYTQPNRKTVIVTGGAQGIGMATAHAFARSGASVIIADIDREAGEEWEGRLVQEGFHAVHIPCDVAEEAQVASMIEESVKRLGAIDVLINNAGIGWIGGFMDRTTADWDRVINVNLRGAYLCSRYAAPHMPPGSAIVNIASTRAVMSEPDTEPYAASKAGLLGLTHALALTLGERGIRVNAISPGWIDVSNWKKSSARKQIHLSERDHRQHPAGRVGRPEDIAELCLFLSDAERSGFITGQNFVCDGGMTKKMIYVE
ncbi:MAG: oxidoreductase [Candidatus Hydrogenedentota bacterium]